jgi:hypothetical protein
MPRSIPHHFAPSLSNASHAIVDRCHLLYRLSGECNPLHSDPALVTLGYLESGHQDPESAGTAGQVKCPFTGSLSDAPTLPGV